MTHKKILQQCFIFSVFIILLVIVQNFTISNAYAQTVYSASLTGPHQVPPNTSPGKGTATLTLLPGNQTAQLSLSFSGLLGTEVNSHLHAPAGPGDTNAIQVIIPLGSPITNYMINLTAQQLQWLQQGLIYIDVHSNIYPDGEIRDQLRPMATPTPLPTATPIPTTTTAPLPTSTLIPTQPMGTITPIMTNPVFTMTPIPTMPMPSITAGLGHTVLSFSGCLHGLGKCGDNVSPMSGGNMTPQHQQKQITITVINGNNQVVATQQGVIGFNAASGNFMGSVDLGTLATGNYLIKEKTNGFLSAQLPGIVQITTSTTNILPTVTEVTGDINNDNQLDILDYNAILNCYGTKQTTATCTSAPTAQSAGSDINDDGVVNGTDYNLFLRELSVQKGQ